MPFQSKSQAAFMFANHPKMAKEWASKTPNMKKLPEHKAKSDAMKRRMEKAQ